MKRILKNLALWLIVAVLLLILYNMVYPNRLQQILNPTPAQKLQQSRISELMQQKMKIEQQLFDLELRINAQKAAPTSIFVLFTNMDESMITQACLAMDQYKMMGLMGISEEDVLCWEEAGVPAYVRERLEKGWEICLLLESASAQMMQERLNALGLPSASSAYSLNVLHSTNQSAVHILFEEVENFSQDQDDEIWRVMAAGNMNTNSLTWYNERRNRGDAVAYLVGNRRADQHFSIENLMALMELIAEDKLSGAVQNVSVLEAVRLHHAYQERMAELQLEWDLQQQVLREQLDAVLRQITSETEL